MERRDQTRKARRVAVRFTELGTDKVRSGFTTDISHTGMFIGTNAVLAPGTRLRVEVVDAAYGFMLEGVVARALRRNPAMGQAQPSGMGVRFLQVEELVASLFPHASSSELRGDSSPGPAPSRAADSRRPSPSAPAAAGGGESVPRRGFLVRFHTAADVERTWARDVAQGGLFVAAREPAPVGETVILEIHPPADAPAGRKVRLEARVVHNFDRSSGDETNLLSGMGVEFLDPDFARGALRTLLGR